MKLSLTMVLVLGLGINSIPIAQAENNVAQKYQEECGACHFAYDARFLPARSWEKIMATLDKHFNENAEMAAAETQAISAFLADGAGDRSRKIPSVAGLSASDTPLRITDAKYFKRWHDEVPAKVFKNNPGLKNFSQCKACHANADKGNYDEDEVRIPGYANWE